MSSNKRRRKKVTPGRILLKMIAIVLVFVLVVAFGGRAILNWRYPLKYTDIVEKYSTRYDVDENLIYAVIKTESGFDNYAVSEVGARGLMQMTEETFDWIRTKIGGTETFDDLYQPEVSIHYGTYLLNYLLDEFDGDVDTAMSAYHAGSASVRSWLKNPANSEDGRRLNHSPKADTEHYVNKINRAIGIYERRTAAE